MDVLIVHEPFNGYQKGDQISDANLIAVILASENAGHVVKSTVQPPTPIEGD